MKLSFYTVLAVFTLISAQLNGQIIEQISAGNSYAFQTYYDLNLAKKESVPNIAWDIAFTAGNNKAGIIVNEGVAYTTGQPLPQVILYATDAKSFETVSISDTTERLYNNETSWQDGAFNQQADKGDPEDFGWGQYDAGQNAVIGDRIFLLKPRTGGWIKIIIESLKDGKYSMKYGSLAGSNTGTAVIDKSKYNGQTFAYYRFENNSDFGLEPQSWDLVFMRYSSPLDAGNGDTLNYTLTGILTNEGVSVARAEGVNPNTVDFSAYESELSTDLDVIGHDWKYFDLGSFSWEVLDDRAYFIKARDGKVWKMVFIDFEGASTGTATFEKTFVTTLVSTSNLSSTIPAFGVAPNPASNFARVFVETKLSEKSAAEISIMNLGGSVVHTQTVDLFNGFQQFTIPVNSLDSGNYIISIRTANDVVSTKLIVVD